MESVLKQPRNQILAVARELGFSGLEIEVRADAPELLKFDADAGLPICSVICGGEGAGDIQVERRIAAHERLQQAIRDAALLHASGILWPMFALTSMDDGAVVDRFVEDVSACLSDADAHGIVVAWETRLTQRTLGPSSSEWDPTSSAATSTLLTLQSAAPIP